MFVGEEVGKDADYVQNTLYEVHKELMKILLKIPRA